MLKGTKSVTMSYQSIFEDKVAVYMSAQIPENGRSSISTTIQDLELYGANKAACRADMTAFDQLVYEGEDAMTAEPEVPPTEPEVTK